MAKALNEVALNEAKDALFGMADYAMSKWSDILEGVKRGKPEVSELTLATTAICLENTDRFFKRMDETTAAVNVGSFIKHGFELIAAVLPSLIANEIVSVQPMTRRQGEIFFLEFLYGTTRGDIAAGTKMFAYDVAGSAQAGAGISYTHEKEIVQTLSTGDGAHAHYGAGGVAIAPLNAHPLVAGTLVITAKKAGGVVMTVHDDGTGNLIGDIGAPSSVVLTTGVVDVTFGFNVAAGEVVSAVYDNNFETNSELIPEVDISITSIPVTAENQKCRARYTLDAAWDVEQAFGRSVDTELKASLAAEVRQETDGRILSELMAGGTATGYTFNRTPDTGVPWSEHKWAFYDKSVLPTSNAIFQATRRAVGNFMAVGTDVSSVVEALAPLFKREGTIQPGPHYLGTLGDFRVYKNPYYNSLKYLLGYKGNMFLEAGYVWAPYLPLYTTRTIVLDDMVGRFGMVQSYGRKFVNSKFFAPVTIS